MVVAEFAPVPKRIWRRQPFRHNPLMRGSDRFESVIRGLAVVVMLIAVPMAGAFGTSAYTSEAARIASDNAAKSAVTATVTADPVQVSTADTSGTSADTYQAPVRWDENGRSGVAIVEVPRTAARDGQIQLWLGHDGQTTSAPEASSSAAVHGISFAFMSLAGIWACALVFVWSTGRVLNVCRSSAWAREWRQISRPLGQDK
ncbi:hypothetical protein DFR76_11598 [Nocardia pseudobrasiliensis]|uniref:Transmembrane protein n=1 Tax=Nocardia pseudobrasiliensis TaxID=45979 RepID=A0A370HPN9_9NOCA|nr:hypothetical protein DFR76_11598 [Nocardia pseudobrasiliensis]